MKPIAMAILLAGVLAGGPVVRAAEPVVCGYMGDRSGVYPGANPPVRWDDRTNVLWKVPVPNLGNAAPAVGGNRVFVLSEPGWKHDLPVISCYDAGSGALRWEKEINHLHLTIPDEAERAKVREAWHKHLAWCRDFYLLFHDWVAARDSPEVKRRMASMGIEQWGANYLYRRADPDKVSEYSMYTFHKKHPEVGKGLIGLDTWRCMGSHDHMWIGEVFGTPVTDGEAVYVATAWGVYASYDLEGRLRWMHALSPERPHDYCAVARSPILYRDLVISDLGRWVRAFDRASGALEWEHRREGPVHEFVSPVVFRVGGRDVLWCAGPGAYVLPEGKPLTIEGWKNNGLMVTVNRDRPDTLFFTGGGEHGGWEGKGRSEHPPPAAVRFTLAGETLKARVLWSGVNGEMRKGPSGMVYRDGRLYLANGGHILDAETGIVLKGLFGRAVPPAIHQLAVAGGHVYGFTNGGGRGEQPAGVMQVHDLDGRPVATNRLHVTPFAELDADSRDKRLSQWYSWPKSENREWCFTYSASFNIGGGRIYIRSLDYLYCIGAKGPPAAVDVAKETEALLKAGDWAKLAALGPAARAVAPQVEAQLPKVREPWQVVACLAAIDPERAAAHRDVLVKAIVNSNLSDHLTPQAGGLLYELGPMPRAQLAPIEAAVDRRMYPHGGPKIAQQLLSAFYRRSGEVGFTHVNYRPLPWQGVPERGKEVTLSWSTIHADKVRIEPGIGEVAKEGELTVQIRETTEYVFTAEGPGGPTVRTIVVPIKVSVREFKAEPQKVAAGGEVTIRWDVANADSVTITPGLGKVEAAGEKKITVAKTTEFTLEATGPEGPVTRKSTVTVE